jgi:hypothetical protein
MEDPLRDEASFIECGWVLVQLCHSVGLLYSMPFLLHATYSVLLQAAVCIARCSEPAGVACLRAVPPVAELLETIPDTSISECSWKAGQVCILSTVTGTQRVRSFLWFLGGSGNRVLAGAR